MFSGIRDVDVWVTKRLLGPYRRVMTSRDREWLYSTSITKTYVTRDVYHSFSPYKIWETRTFAVVLTLNFERKTRMESCLCIYGSIRDKNIPDSVYVKTFRDKTFFLIFKCSFLTVSGRVQGPSLYVHVPGLEIRSNRRTIQRRRVTHYSHLHVDPVLTSPRK